MALDLNENLLGLCLSFLDIRKYNWMLNLVNPKARKVLCEKWKKESHHTRQVIDPRDHRGIHDRDSDDDSDDGADGDADGDKRFIIMHEFYGQPYFKFYKETKTWLNEQGVPHRIGGPAIIGPHFQQWRVNGLLHREDGPACICFGPDYFEQWYLNGKLHRLDGPATIRSDNDHCMDSDGKEEWWVDGKKHRTDGPAVTKFDGKQQWWVDGKYQHS